MRHHILALLVITLAPALGCARPDYLSASDTANAQSTTLSFPTSGLQASLEFTDTPTSTAENKFEIKFINSQSGATTESGPYVDPVQSVNVLIWMPAMGHGSSPVTLTRTAQGVYDVSRAYFIMPGAWQIRVQLKDTSGVVVEEADFALKVP